MRLIADENIPRRLVAILRGQGFDIISIAETDIAASDLNILALAAAQNRIILTQDHDFGDLVIRRQISVPGVVLVQLQGMSAGARNDRILRFLTQNPRAAENAFVVIEPSRVRIRPLAPPGEV